jgi:peptidoglycan hydrolase-like protein with peptidoglycan-binding domain
MRHGAVTEADATGEPMVSFISQGTEKLGEQDARLTGVWAKGAVVHAPPWSGLVSGVSVQIGSAIHSYDTVAQIDGIARQGWSTDHPFYRPLARDDKGDDVTALQSALSDLGYLQRKPSGVMDGATVAAVKAYSKDIGFATAQEVFDPGWIVYLPAAEIIAGKVELAVSAPAPSPGEAILTARDSLSSAAVALASGDLPQPAQQWEVVVGDQKCPLDNSGHIAADCLGVIQDSDAWSAAGDDAGIDVTIRRAEPITAYQVPVASLGVGAEGDHCVWTVHESPATPSGAHEYKAIPVELVQDRPQTGVATVTGLTDGLVIVANPRAALGLISCQ